MNKDRKSSIGLAFRFHVNFYHSYRGDGLDDRGIGKDIRVIRGILDDLDRLNAEGVPVRGTWDIENYYSLELYMPRHASDIIDRIKRRVSEGSDEVELMSYNNGIVPAHDGEEARRAVAWAISNPAGSGLADVFGSYAPIVRPQECMFTPSNIADYSANGIEVLSLYYSAVPFNGFGSFVPPLPFADRYNPLTLRCADEERAMTLLPAYNHGDIVERGLSLRSWIASARKRQLAMEEEEDLILLIDMDADDLFWEGLKIPLIGPLFPSFSGLYPLVRSVADLPFVEFVRPWDYVRAHPPRREVSFGQDCADGSWDGYSSWAEKRENLEVWSIIDRSRRLADAASALAADRTDAAFTEAKDEALTERVLALSTTHFGMASPVMNAARLVCAFDRARKAEERGRDLLKMAAMSRTGAGSAAARGRAETEGSAAAAEAASGAGISGAAAPRPPARFLDAELDRLSGGSGSLLILDAKDDGEGLEGYLLENGESGFPKRCVLRPLGAILDPDGLRGVDEKSEAESPAASRTEASLSNGLLALEAKPGGEWRLVSLHEPAPPCTVMPPRVTYGGRTLRSLLRSSGRSRLIGEGRAAEFADEGAIRFPSGEEARWTRRFTLVRGLPYLYVDLEIEYPDTAHVGYGAEKASRLGRTWDARWKEALPCELVPDLGATKERPVRVWKHNFEDRISGYSLDYHRYGPNRKLPSVNNHVTDGWVAVSGARGGLLVAQSASGMTSFAFCPLRSSLSGDDQRVRLNPFGTYFGPQLRYPTAGNGLGRAVSVFMGNQYDSYAPSWAGGRLRSHLMLASYGGDAPEEGLRRDALTFASLPVAAGP